MFAVVKSLSTSKSPLFHSMDTVPITFRVSHDQIDVHVQFSSGEVQFPLVLLSSSIFIHKIKAVASQHLCMNNYTENND